MAPNTTVSPEEEDAVLSTLVVRAPPSARSLLGDGTRSSSDGMRVRVAVNAANADRNAAYFGPGRGLTIYGHTADFRLPYHTQVISTNDRDAPYVIDGLCNHETDLHIHEHFTDTHALDDRRPLRSGSDEGDEAG